MQSEYKDAFERLLSAYYRYSPAVAYSMKRYKPLKLMLRYGLVILLVFSLKLLVALFKLMRTFLITERLGAEPTDCKIAVSADATSVKD